MDGRDITIDEMISYERAREEEVISRKKRIKIVLFSGFMQLLTLFIAIAGYNEGEYKWFLGFAYMVFVMITATVSCFGKNYETSRVTALFFDQKHMKLYHFNSLDPDEQDGLLLVFISEEI